MKNKVFDFLRFMAETGITAIGVAYLGLATVWNLPYGEQIKSTALILSTLLGVFVGVSRNNYNKQNQFGSTTREEIAHDAEGEING